MCYRNHCTWESPKLQLHDTVHVLVFLASPFCKLQLTANCLNLTHDYFILHTPGHCTAPGGFEMRMLQGIFLQRYVYDYNYVGLSILLTLYSSSLLLCRHFKQLSQQYLYLRNSTPRTDHYCTLHVPVCVCSVCILWNPALAIKFDRGVAPVIRKSVNLLRPHVRPKLMYFLLLRLYQPNWSN